ncbi:type II toxin-antitoxin system RelE/ParE family toxin [Sphingomonas sp. DG1-23]|uniref:type II toxin-antitoxin system RelE/ParE family toxin n=1 Tax=Sphingomonas sp. DG1-23 TaxID=3068316 RepID=UPI00273DD3A8|nr:type II toxin-antitoxin system RelE/ParE family toxin [Sphingomonas sp. DG1-23]MDP5279446.1 type II toxin-antitoxin system RelE/ParE family toxin [Sphingomonas sp. DG1-23]
MRAIRWAPFAQGDLHRIARFYQTIDPVLAANLTERIVKATRVLSELPQAGQATTRAHRRRWRVPRTDYVIFYRVERDHIRILRVLHGAQQLAGKL